MPSTPTPKDVLPPPPMFIESVPGIRSLALYQRSTYVPVSSACLFIYDYLLTFDGELRFVWNSRGGFGKVLFVLTRYTTFGDVVLAIYRNIGPSMGETTCRSLYDVTGWLTIAGIVIAEVILVVRVWALWNRSLKLGMAIITTSIAFIIGASVAYVNSRQSNSQFARLDTISPVLLGCFPNNIDNMEYISYLFVMIFEILMVFLLLIKGLNDLRRRPSSFLYSIYRDGFAYYAVLSSISILNVIVLLSGPWELANLLVAPQRVLHSIFSARLLISLRQDASRFGVCDTITQPVGDSIFFPSVITPINSQRNQGDDHQNDWAAASLQDNDDFDGAQLEAATSNSGDLRETRTGN